MNGSTKAKGAFNALKSYALNSEDALTPDTFSVAASKAGLGDVYIPERFEYAPSVLNPGLGDVHIPERFEYATPVVDHAAFTPGANMIPGYGAPQAATSAVLTPGVNLMPGYGAPQAAVHAAPTPGVNMMPGYGAPQVAGTTPALGSSLNLSDVHTPARFEYATPVGTSSLNLSDVHVPQRFEYATPVGGPNVSLGDLRIPQRFEYATPVDGSHLGGGDVHIPEKFDYATPEPSLVEPDSGASANATFDITLNYTGDERFRSAFTSAAARWQQIITADLPDVNSTQFGLIDDLRIDARIEAIDGAGGVLGSAGPDSLRTGSLLPFHGTMRFDSADVESLSNSGRLTDVILHEMGHVLGIGTIWGQNALGFQNGEQYTGQHALAEYRALAAAAGATFVPDFVPVETDGGQGTAFGHWDDETFNNELMTGFLNSGANPISRMTIGALEDFGYTVNYGVANAYALPRAPTRPTPVADDFADSVTDTTAPFGQVAIGGTATGNLETLGDHDLFRVQLTGGATYTIQLNGGTLSDPLLTLRNGTGAVLAQNDDFNGLNSQITFTATGTGLGTFFIDAGAFNNSGRGTYTVSVAGPPANRAPVIDSNGGGDTAVLAVAENSTTVTTVHAADPDAGQALTYAIVGGADAGLFQINATTGALTFVNSPNFEAPADADSNNSYLVQVRAADNGSPSLSDIQTLTVNVTNQPELGVANTHDFNGDGTSDLLFRNASGALLELTVRNNQVVGSATLGQLGTEWANAGLGDFNGDGTTDMLFRRADGTLLELTVRNNTVVGSANLGNIGPEWRNVGLGDFNGDGTTDMLFRRADGTLLELTVRNNQVVGSATLGQLGTEWANAGLGDFNGDGTTDMLFRRADGTLLELTVRNNQVVGSQNLGNIGPEWANVAVGDFNRDGTSDLLFRRADGTLLDLLVRNNQVVGSANLGNIGPEWRSADVGDFNGDATSDMLFRNASGTLLELNVNNNTVVGSANLGNIGTEWQLFT